MLDPAPFPAEPEVFYDSFAPSVQFSAFGGSKVDALDIEYEEVYRGTAALKFTIPAPTDPSGSYAGGVFYAEVPRDLTGFDALTFWARASGRRDRGERGEEVHQPELRRHRVHVAAC